jgi:hypothetical protein
MLLMGRHYGDLACQKLAVAALLPLNQNVTTCCQWILNFCTSIVSATIASFIGSAGD